MPAEQEARVIANDAMEHDGWLDPVDMMRLARAYLALEAELLAAQEREKALQVRADTFEQAARFHAERKKALREAARSVQIGLGQTAYEGTTVSVWSAKRYERILADALAGSPSEKPGSGQNHPPITSSNPKAKRELAEKPGSEEEA